jgi:competence protein ComEA
MNKYWWWLASFIILCVLVGSGVLLLVSRPTRGEPIQLQPPPTPAPIMVYVSGEVTESGLYILPAGSRVNDAIQAAGGFTKSANTDQLNLAEILEDGQQINVPLSGLSTNPDDQTRSINPALILLDINMATVEQLDTLPEIGPITAQVIIDYRNKNGPFDRIEDILDVPGIGQVTFNKIKDLITTGTTQ